MDQVEEIKQKTDIVEIISDHVTLKKAGRNYKGLCPFHGEKTPSFMVNPELQIYKCFGCGEGGDVFSFLQKIEGMEFGEVLKMLAKRTGVKLVSYKPTGVEEEKERLISINNLACEAYHYVLTKHDSGKRALEYLKSRNIGEEEIEKFKLGFAPGGWDFLVKFLGVKKNMKLEDVEKAGLVIRVMREGGRTGYYDRFRERIMFPLNNQRGQTVGFSGRVLPGSDEKAGGKYINSPETQIYHKGELLYGLDITRSEIKKLNKAVVVEGEIDAIASCKAGIENVVAIKGSALTPKQVELLRRVCDEVVLALDADMAGDAAARRGIEVAESVGLIIKVVKMKGAKDPGELAMENPQEWKKCVEEAVVIYDFYLNSAVERYGLDVVGKQRIGRELLPIWAKIGDEIVKAHYIKKLASILGVDEEDVRAQIKKASPLEMKIEAKTEEVKRLKPSSLRREVLEEYVVGLLVGGDRVGVIDERLKGLVQNSHRRRMRGNEDARESQ
jgi:DNA primase